jgi:hypothetical protein
LLAAGVPQNAKPESIYESCTNTQRYGCGSLLRLAGFQRANFRILFALQGMLEHDWQEHNLIIASTYAVRDKLLMLRGTTRWPDVMLDA